MKFTFRAAPNYRQPRSTKQIMKELTLALLVVCLFAVAFNFMYYGSAYAVKAALMLVVSCAVAAVVEVIWAKMCKKDIKEHIAGSFPFVTALIFALTCPIGTPLYAVGVGSFFAIFFGKLIFGGFGHNIFNPAGIGRAVLFSAFSSQTVGYLAGATATNPVVADAVSTVTPTTYMAGTLGWVVESGEVMTTFLEQYGGLSNLLFGFYQGALGETSAILLIVIGVVLAIRKVIDWRVPTIYVGTVFVLASIISAMHGFDIRYPLFHVLTGGLLFGAVFMATDPVTNPTNPAGRVVYALGLGILTVLIRVKANLPEGVLYSILLMNMLSPLIDSAMDGNQIKNLKRNITISGVVAAVGVATVAGVAGGLEAKEPVTAITGGATLTVEDATSSFPATGIETNGNTHVVTVKGFAGQNVVTVETDGTKVTKVSMTEIGDTPGIGDLVDDPVFLGQFVGVDASADFTVDAVTTATNTSKSVMSAVYAALHPETVGAASKTPASDYFPATIDSVDGNVYTVSVQSFMGTNVLKITLDGSKITYVEFVEMGDTPGFVDNCNTNDFLGQFEGQDVSAVEVDTVSGATKSSESVLAAVYAVAQQAGASGTPASDYFPATIDSVDGNVYTVSVQSFMGTNVVKVTLDGTTISSVEFVSKGDTPSFVDNCDTADFLGQFAGQDVKSVAVDTVSGATKSSESVLSAVYAVSQQN